MKIAVTNRKGGVGKSTMASHIAAGLAARGYYVGLVDTDSQGNASMMLGIESSDGLHRLMIDRAPLQEVVLHVPLENFAQSDTRGRIYLIPSSRLTYEIPYRLKEPDTFLFFEQMEAFQAAYNLDVILIDTNPSLSMFDGSIYLAADGFIYVTECEMLSLDGIREATEQMERFTHIRRTYLNRESKILGIVPNKYRGNTIIHQENLKHLRAAFGQLVWPPIPLHTRWAECSNLYRPVFLEAPKSHAARHAWVMIDHVERSMETWEMTAVVS